MKKELDNRDKHENKTQVKRDAKGLWLPGFSPNPKGRPKGKTLKEWARERLVNMNEKERAEFIATLPRDIVWRMAEGNPANETDITTKGEKINALTPEDIALAKKINDTSISNTGTDQSSEGSVAESVDSEVSDQK